MNGVMSAMWAEGWGNDCSECTERWGIFLRDKKVGSAACANSAWHVFIRSVVARTDFNFDERLNGFGDWLCAEIFASTCSTNETSRFFMRASFGLFEFGKHFEDDALLCREKLNWLRLLSSQPH